MKNHRKLWSAAFFVTVAGSTPALAVDAGAVFAGLVLSTCALTVGTPGVMTANAGYTSLSSENAGGSRSTVVALTTGATFNISALAPSTFTAGDSSNVTFATDYTLTGSTSASDILGVTTTLLNIGTTTVAVDLTATKSTGNFPAGAYAATVTVRCE